MATNVGSLNATLSLSDWEFQQGLKQSETAAIQFARTTEVASNRANTALSKVGSKSNAPQMFTQVGYAIQDFSSQIETRGLGGAIGAVTNNVQMLGQAFGAAVGGIILPKVIDWVYNTKQLAEASKKAEDSHAMMVTHAKELASLEVKGGSEKAKKDAEDQIAINRLLKTDATETLRDALKAQWELKKQENAIVRGASGVGALAQYEVGLHPITAKLAAADAEVKRRDADLKRIINESDLAEKTLREVGPGTDIAKADEQRDRLAMEKKNSEDAVKAAENLAKLKIDGLTKYGTEQQKLESKLEQQVRDFHSKFGLNLGEGQQRDALAALQAEGDVERHKLMMSEAQKREAELGTAAKGSAGVDLASSAGVQAINRAVSGTRSEQDLAKQAQKTREAQLKALEDIARQKADVIQVSLSG